MSHSKGDLISPLLEYNNGSGPSAWPLLDHVPAQAIPTKLLRDNALAI
jgi:hypothetical protein